MSKEEILKGWQYGDDAEVARLMKEKHNITVGRSSLSRWRRKYPNVSPLSEKYIQAFHTVQQNRK